MIDQSKYPKVYELFYSSKIFQKAYRLAEQIFQGQTRKGSKKTSKMEHNLEVAELVLENGGTIIDAIAALLHDAVEDSRLGRKAMKAKIHYELGNSVCELVMEVTDAEEIKHLPTSAKKRAQAQRMSRSSLRARNIKVADQTSNLKEIVENPPEDWSPSRCHDYTQGALEIVSSCNVSDFLRRKFLEAYEPAWEMYCNA